MNNIEIRKILLVNDIRNYVLAEWLGISEWTLCRRLRKELPEEEKQRVISAINDHVGGDYHAENEIHS